MGRDKGQRVKGNVKPASSGRTAEMVNFQTVTFESLSGGAGTGIAGTFVPIIPDSEETGLDPQLSLTLRKLGKKDPTTKIKALTELLDQCKEDSTLPLSILPYWPRIYVRLAVDEARKVRELCHNLLYTIANSVGRNLGPHMKGLFPTWFLSQNDTFPPAASAAANAFKLIFPTEEKQLQAIKFCSTEIVSLVIDRLDGKEELDKFTALAGLKRIVQLNVGEEIGTIFKEDKFWAIAKDESSLVRRSFFDLMSSVAEKCPGEVPKSKLTRTITASLAEEKYELQSLWNCFLTLTLYGVFEEMNVAKTQLLLCCKRGFYSNASKLGPLLLPLVHKIGTFGDEIFLAIEEGFKSERSTIERQAILRTYAEVLSYEYKQSEVIPTPVFTFITSELKQSIEFGGIVSRLVKNESFYNDLSNFCMANEEIMTRPDFGAFLLSFVEGKKSVQFEGTSQNVNKYEDLEQKAFVKNLSLKLLELKNYKAFSRTSRYFTSEAFFNDILNPSEISQVFQCTEDNKLEILRIGLDLVKGLPNTPAALVLVSTTFDLFLEDLGTFVKEIEPFDSLKPIRNWLRMDHFSQNTTRPVLKYILKKGTHIFSQETIQSKVQQLAADCENQLDLISELLREPKIGTDLTEVYFTVWDHYLRTTSNEQLEALAHRILEQNLISYPVIYNKLSGRVQFCETLEGINTLIELSLKILLENNIEFQTTELSCQVDPDLLIFRGFKFPELRNPSLHPPAQFKIDKVLKVSIYEGRLGLEIGTHLPQIGLNLLYAKTLYLIDEDLESTNWNKTSHKELGDEITILLTRVLEKIASDPQQWKEFSRQVSQKAGDSIWNSKFPLEEFMHTARKMELPTHITPVIPTDLSDIESIFQSYLNIPDLPVQFLIDMLTTERNDNPVRFHFETLFSHVEQKQQLIFLLELTMELMSREESFLSTAACWISAWLRNSKNIILDNKLSLLWTSKLSRAVTLIHQLSKTSYTFTQEYVEFHTANLFPVVYAHFTQLMESKEPWHLFTAQNVAEAVSFVPKLTLQAIEQESIKIFQLFTPVLKRPEIFFKVAAYKLMKKVTVKDEIIPKELNNFFQRLKDNMEYPNESIVTYLFAWDALLHAQPNANELAQYVKEDKLLPRLLALLFFTLVPEKPKQYFETDVEISTGTTPNLEHLSCSVLLHVLRSLPYTVRAWWTALAKQRDKVHVEKMITKYLSAKLAAEELGKVKWNEKEDNVTVHCLPGCNELVARYKIEETSVELTITLPLNHPLGPVAVQISDKKLHARIYQLLNTRSHSLSAGLLLWKQNLDSLYVGIEPCPVCFFINHQGNTPKLQCKTCRNKYHAACLYKWFSTSNKSECPMCRNLF